jgi:uncharacterized Ntn-hydrolase superfamily protein
MPSLRLVLAFLLAFVGFVAPAAATWSILIVNLATGEIAVGIATCLTGFDLKPNTVVVVPGYGVAAAQSFVGPLSLRELIRTGLLNGTPASAILAQLAAADTGHQSRQYGIASLFGGQIAFTGTGAGAWAGDRVGQTGTLRYTIQGNVLTGQAVVNAAELAILNTPGSIGDKLMAAMDAARLMGGDGRCSCNVNQPTACGAPPASFTKSSHIGLMIWSRPSDLDLPCTSAAGCGAGSYWMDLNVANQTATAPDPVLQLQTLYSNWKQSQIGRPDHYQSTVTLSANTLRANGVDTVTGTVVLRDAQGNPLGNTRPVTVALRAGSTATGVSFSPVTPAPNGAYTFTMQGNLGTGTAIVDVATADAVGRVGVWPQPVVQVTDLFGACGAGAVPGLGSAVVDVLKVNGTAGTARIATAGLGQSFTLSLDAPAGGSQPAPAGMFALWAHVGRPAVGGEVPLGGSGGALCFTPSPFAPSPTALVADSFGLGGAVFAPGAPWTLTVPSVLSLLDVALQGVMVVDAAGSFAATNAVLLRIVPLPAPTITVIAPPSPTAGQTVAVSGANFLPGMLATLVGAPLPITVTSPTQAQFVAPAGLPCDAVLQVANLGTAIATRLVNATPVVSNVPYQSGPAAGNALYILVGQNLLGCTVTIGGAPMTISSQNATSIVGQTPPGAVGPATVVIRNPNGCQTTRTYTYL